MVKRLFVRNTRFNRFFLIASMLLISGCSVAPVPLTENEISDRAQSDAGRLFADQEAIQGPVSLFEAMARALKYNLDRRVKRMEEAVSMGDLDMARLEMLPQLAASGGYSARDTDPKSVSEGSFNPSTSQERHQSVANVALVWNVLDFGVSYVQAKQQADRVLIAQEQRRRATQNIIQDVRAAYWRAVAADRLLPKLDHLLIQTESALQRSRNMEHQRVQSPMKALDFQQTLLETIKQILSARKQLTLASSELAALMNVKPGERFFLTGNDQETLDETLISFPVETLENIALLKRPELREEDYQERISALEVRKALLGALPGLEFSASGHYDSNKYLVNQAWATAGAQLSLDLFKWISTPQTVEALELSQDLARSRRLALSMAAITQLHLSLQSFGLSNQEYEVSWELNSVHERKMKHAQAVRASNKANEMEQIRNRAEALFAALQKKRAFAEREEALGRLHLSLGLDPLPAHEEVTGDTIKALAQAIEIRQKGLADYVRGTSPEKTAKLDENPTRTTSTIPQPDNKQTQQNQTEAIPTQTSTTANDPSVPETALPTFEPMTPAPSLAASSMAMPHAIIQTAQPVRMIPTTLTPRMIQPTGQYGAPAQIWTPGRYPYQILSAPYPAYAPGR
ncbi:MAG: TolC family protein [Magnetococcales bacterium]|nr:TolC family protein [Magnetococcales bacterium]